MLATVVNVVLLNPPLPDVVNADQPSPPTDFFTRMIRACSVLLNMHVAVPPPSTVKAPAPGALGDPFPTRRPSDLLQLGAAPCCQPAGIVSAIVNVCVGSMFV